MGIGFWNSKFEGVLQNFLEFPGWNLFSGIFKVKVTNLKIQRKGGGGGGGTKPPPPPPKQTHPPPSQTCTHTHTHHPCLDFLWNSPLWFGIFKMVIVSIASQLVERVKLLYCCESTKVLSYVSKNFFYSVCYKNE